MIRQNQLVFSFRTQPPEKEDLDRTTSSRGTRKLQSNIRKSVSGTSFSYPSGGAIVSWRPAWVSACRIHFAQRQSE
jgi:hypothetical protein